MFLQVSNSKQIYRYVHVLLLRFKRTIAFELLALMLLLQPAYGVECYSCEGFCYSNENCNCHTGSCEAPYCFLRRGRDPERGYTIMKGCANRLQTGQTGCFNDEQSTHVSCYCDSQDFCNGYLEEQSPQSRFLPSINCNDCASSEGTCGKQCHNANYCILESSVHSARCGYGYPVIPFVARSKELIRQAATSGICITQREGPEPTSGPRPLHTLCICARPRCNLRSAVRPLIQNIPAYQLLTCYACAEAGPHISSLSVSCRDTTCQGHFCTVRLKTAATVTKGPVYERVAGCMNTTMPELVMTGCYHEWVSDREELIECACRSSNYCNSEYSIAIRAKCMLWLHLASIIIVLVLSRGAQPSSLL